MDNITVYSKLKKSSLDNSVPASYTKIGIQKKEHIRGIGYTYNGLLTSFCTAPEICKCDYKPCMHAGYCPYLYDSILKAPRAGTKAYEEYITELNYQMTIRYLNGHIDENTEKAIYGELDEKEYKSLMVRLSNAIDEYSVKWAVDYNKIFKDILKIINVRKAENQISQAKNERLVYDYFDYYNIKVSHIPTIKDKDGKSVWTRQGSSDLWIEKTKFDKWVWEAIKNAGKNGMIGYWLVEEYDKKIKILGEQLEHYYGLMTMFKLMD